MSEPNFAQAIAYAAEKRIGGSLHGGAPHHGLDDMNSAMLSRVNIRQDATTLAEIADRILDLAEKIRESGNKLRDHADAVHGAGPELNSSGSPAPKRDGAIGKVNDALDDLERAYMFVLDQSVRNTSLA